MRTTKIMAIIILILLATVLTLNSKLVEQKHLNIFLEQQLKFEKQLNIEFQEKEVLEQENRELEQENRELKQTLYDRSYTISRAGRTNTALIMTITQPSGFSAEMFEQAFANTNLAGIGEALIMAESEHGINSLVLAGVVVLESGWGRSEIARDKNNLAGLGAYDGNETSSAITFSSRTSNILFLARLLAVDYAPGGKYFSGSHDLEGIGKRYATDPRWARKVARVMQTILKRVA